MKKGQANSGYQKAWRRFRANRPAFSALWFIGVAIGIALFGYLIAPDDTPDANTQIAEIALLQPGAHVALLEVPFNRPALKISWMQILLHGRPPKNRMIPVRAESVALIADSIHYQRIGSGFLEEKVHLVQTYFGVSDSILKQGTAYLFTDADGRKQRMEQDFLVKKFASKPPVNMHTFPLGTDKYGRCILSRLILGFRVSLFVGCIAVLISLTLGLFLGALGGYLGGRVDDLVMLLVNTVWSIPTLLLVFAIVLALGRGIGVIFFAVGLTMWVEVARVVRGQVLVLRESPFVEAAKSMGMGTGRILFRHILPNLLGPVMVVAAGNFATAILVESGLSFLGFGVQPPAPSWGSMLNENYGYAIGGKPLLALAPALTIALTVLAFNLVGNGLRDAIDVKGR